MLCWAIIGVDRFYVDQAAYKHEFWPLNFSALRNWVDKNLRDLWGMIIWNHTLQARYPNFLILAELAHVRCVST